MEIYTRKVRTFICHFRDDDQQEESPEVISGLKSIFIAKQAGAKCPVCPKWIIC